MSISYRYQSNYDDAVYLVNTGFIKIINGLKSFDNTKPLEPWMKVIMVNVALDEFRKNKKYNHHVVLIDDENFLNDIILTDSFSELDMSEYWTCFEALPEPEKTVFNLFAIDGYAHKEIAEKLGFSERSSKRYLNSARAKLSEILVKNDLIAKRA